MSGKQAKRLRSLARAYVQDHVGYTFKRTGSFDRNGPMLGTFRYGHQTYERVYRNLKRFERHPRRFFDIANSKDSSIGPEATHA